MKRALVGVIVGLAVLAGCSSSGDSGLRNEVRTKLEAVGWSTCGIDYQVGHLDKHTMQTFVDVDHLVDGTVEDDEWHAVATEAEQACGGTILAHPFHTTP